MDVTHTMRKTYSEPSYTENFADHGQILQIHLSPFEWSQNLLLLAFDTKIIVAVVNFENAPSVRILSEFKYPSRCSSLALSPKSTIDAVPNHILFCAAGNDFKLRIYSSDVYDNNMCRMVSGHNWYINETSFNPANTYLASVSDDNTARIWNTDDFKLKSTYNLTSAGVSICWHRADETKLLVGEKIGLVRLYNIETDIPILSLDYGKPLIGTHWAPWDSQMVASLHLGELLIWDLANPCLPAKITTLFTENGGSIMFCPQGELIAATNRLEGTMKVVHIKSQDFKLVASVTLPTNVCWHYRQPVVCIGDDTRLCFWKLY